jgi:Fe-S-cluster containining protein
MQLPAADAQLVQIMDASLAYAAQRAGAWLACRPGCTQCCHGAFAINALDVARLQAGMQTLQQGDPQKFKEVSERARSWIAQFGSEYPGNAATGVLGTSEDEEARFEEFANDAPCPALDPSSGLCDVYTWRPMTCRVYGPPDSMGDGDSLGCCELCFVDAPESEISRCEMPVPHELEQQIVEQTGDPGNTVVAFALLRQDYP